MILHVPLATLHDLPETGVGWGGVEMILHVLLATLHDLQLLSDATLHDLPFAFGCYAT